MIYATEFSTHTLHKVNARFAALMIAVLFLSILLLLISPPTWAAHSGTQSTTHTQLSESTVKIVPHKGFDYDQIPLLLDNQLLHRQEGGGSKSNSAGRTTEQTKEKAQKKSSEKTTGLVEIARFTIRNYFGLEKNRVRNLNEYAASLKCDPRFRKRAGVFVTLSKKGKTRACWGSIYAQQADIVHETVCSALGAINKEYRFQPIRKSELADLKIQVTVIQEQIPVQAVGGINPLRDGIMVRSGGKSGVILPGEAVDAYYEFVLARLKAGIKPSEPCQIYKLRADIYE